MNIILGNKIKGIRKKRGLSQAQLASLTVSSYQLVSKWERGKVQPSYKKLIKICEALEIPVAELTGKTEIEEISDPGSYTYLPVYNVRGEAGPGEEIEEEKIIDALAFKKSWINNELHAQRSDLFLIYMRGDSMEPTLHANDIILIDRRETGISREGIYVLRVDNSLLVKRLQRQLDGSIDVISDNLLYKPMKLNLNSPVNDLQIIGRVVWMGRRM